MRNEENVSIWPFFNGREAVTRIPPKRGNIHLVILYLLLIIMAITYSTYSDYKATDDFTYLLLMSVSMALLSSSVLLIHQFVFFSDEIYCRSPFGGLFCCVVSFLEPLKEIRASALSVDGALSD